MPTITDTEEEDAQHAMTLAIVLTNALSTELNVITVLIHALPVAISYIGIQQFSQLDSQTWSNVINPHDMHV